MVDSRLRDIFAAIEQVVDDAYKRGKQDAVDAIMKAASSAAAIGSAPKSNPVVDIFDMGDADEDARKRAPRGSAERVIRRAIKAMLGLGATVQDIMAARQGDLEMMLVESSIRGELRRGEKQGKYAERDGRWHEEEEV